MCKSRSREGSQVPEATQLAACIPSRRAQVAGSRAHARTCTHGTTTNRNNISTSFVPGSSMGLSLGFPPLLRSLWKFRDGKPMKPLTHLSARQIVAASNVIFSCHHLPSDPRTFLKCQLLLWSPHHTVPHPFSNTHKHMPTPCFKGTHSQQESLFFGCIMQLVGS